MEKTTPDTQIALIQQSLNVMTASVTRVELKLDKMDEQSRNYATSEQLEKRFNQIESSHIRIETFQALEDKVRSITWGLGILFATVLGFIANAIFKFIGGK